MFSAAPHSGGKIFAVLPCRGTNLGSFYLYSGILNYFTPGVLTIAHLQPYLSGYFFFIYTCFHGEIKDAVNLFAFTIYLYSSGDKYVRIHLQGNRFGPKKSEETDFILFYIFYIMGFPYFQQLALKSNC